MCAIHCLQNINCASKLAFEEQGILYGETGSDSFTGTFMFIMLYSNRLLALEQADDVCT